MLEYQRILGGDVGQHVDARRRTFIGAGDDDRCADDRFARCGVGDNARNGEALLRVERSRQQECGECGQ